MSASTPPSARACFRPQTARCRARPRGLAGARATKDTTSVTPAIFTRGARCDIWPLPGAPVLASLAAAAKPHIECVPDPSFVPASTAAASALIALSPRARAAAHEEYVAGARADYVWMAKEFNRQYVNSHGKEHPDYQPHSADDELDLHYLNGRLWCFYGSVTNATRSLEAATTRQPSHVPVPAPTELPSPVLAT